MNVALYSVVSWRLVKSECKIWISSIQRSKTKRAKKGLCGYENRQTRSPETYKGTDNLCFDVQMYFEFRVEISEKLMRSFFRFPERLMEIMNKETIVEKEDCSVLLASYQ